MRFDERLRGPSLHGDGAAWREAWQALDARRDRPLAGRAARDEPARLTLCGERSSVELAPRQGGWWQRIVATVSPARTGTRALLESL